MSMPTPEPPADNTGWRMTTISDGFGSATARVVAGMFVALLVIGMFWVVL